MPDRGTLTPARDEEPHSGPEARLEWLRFSMQGAEVPASLFDWMQEVERQLTALRKRLNELPVKEPIRW